jgi:peptidoglycan hydrolase CwlO-like protein
MAQPDFQILSTRMQGAANQLSLVPNMPVINQGTQLLDQMQQLQTQMQQFQQEMQGQVQQIQGQVQEVRNEMRVGFGASMTV